MRAQFSLAHLTCLSLAPPDMIEAAARAHYDFVSLRLLPVTEREAPYRLDQDRALLRRTKDALAATGLGVLDIELCKLSASVVVREYQPMLEAGAELGARHVIAGAMDGNEERLAEHLAQLCDLAAPLGLTVDLEPVTFFPISGIAQAGNVLCMADRANAGLLVDTLHFSRSHDRVEALAALPQHWFHFAQLSDAPACGPLDREDLVHAARCERCYLGEGGLAIGSIVAALPPIPYALEIPNEAAVAAHGLQAHITRCLLTARDTLDRAPSGP